MGYKSFGKRRSLRLKHYDYSSPRPIHVIIGTYRRRPYLANRLLVEKLVSLLRVVAEEYGVRVYAYCFMPDHCSGPLNLDTSLRRGSVQGRGRT